ncbi:MAG: hypothetical protein R6U61_00805 [Thermoplasmata archaeon]
MRIILDENLPSHVSKEIKDFHTKHGFLDVDQKHKGILDFELVDKMEEGDVMVTGDLELHKNLLDRGGRSVYYDVQLDNTVDIQIKLAYLVKGSDVQDIDVSSKENEHITSGPNDLLRKRFDELKKENSELRSRVNILEGKIRSIRLTAESALNEEQ